MLFALLIGMAFHFLSAEPKRQSGINTSSREILRIGVALLGARITFVEITTLGLQTALLVVAAVISTIVLGFLLARILGLTRAHAVLSAGAVSICGASAALAIASVLPTNRDLEANTILTVAGVSTLSTVAMMIYPLVVEGLSYDDIKSGIFIGATIHDVAPVVVADIGLL